MLFFRGAVRGSRTVPLFPRRLFASVPFESNLKAGNVSPTLSVPDHIARPPFMDEAPITLIEGAREKAMRSTGRLAAQILNFACDMVKPGITTDEIDRATHAEIIKAGAYPSPLGYRGFPKSICTSINECAAHGIPDDRPLQVGDVINLDITVFRDGVHGDTSRTLLVGEPDQIEDKEHVASATHLLETSYRALLTGIAQCRPGASTSEIGRAIEDLLDQEGLQIIPELVGHGIGPYFHQHPLISHSRDPVTEPVIMKEGMAFTIEPIIKVRTDRTTDLIGMWADDWTIVTLDNSMTAVFEHTILITQNGVDILTLAD